MMPAASVTVIDPTLVSPARAEASVGSHVAAGADGPPTRRLCRASWRSDASAAPNVSRMYSDRIDERFAARVSAALSVCVRNHHRSLWRIADSPSSTAAVSVAIAALDT